MMPSSRRLACFMLILHRCHPGVILTACQRGAMRLDPACVDMRPWASKEALMSSGSMQAESGLEGAHQRLVGAVVADLLQPLLEALGHCLTLRVGAREGEPETVGGDLAHLDHLPAQLLLLDLEVTRHLVHQDVVDPAAHQHLNDLGVGLGLETGDPGVFHEVGGVGVAEGDAHRLLFQRGELEIPARFAGQGEDGEILLEHGGLVPEVLVAVLLGDGGIEAAEHLVAACLVHAAGEGDGAKLDVDPLGGEGSLHQLGGQPLRLTALLVEGAVGGPIILGGNEHLLCPGTGDPQQQSDCQPVDVCCSCHGLSPVADCPSKHSCWGWPQVPPNGRQKNAPVGIAGRKAAHP
ncbi:hypothetical protein AHA_1237 [Aeromonas hydrophila subsp. hydrophila ATCC 7966]|uniref:Uncharacterized protein n=1 Tax=Aeromonas hydrophila subsp. hydrophila (strain ATCC 7966 / DSM 30187 / BCRC 13018 / CCUG 14551 / JCM 1027 / KCTC 2358 / NCIMB 9240 / NCTC 8049) TaxID=380703 RepID=A0KHM6_AERHH|nr:hypothetical protein AHA_1237 [Aeromonas hydrophila subsp. hydrophila ATCC 7966]